MRRDAGGGRDGRWWCLRADVVVLQHDESGEKDVAWPFGRKVEAVCKLRKVGKRIGRAQGDEIHLSRSTLGYRCSLGGVAIGVVYCVFPFVSERPAI